MHTTVETSSAEMGLAATFQHSVNHNDPGALGEMDKHA